MTTTIYKSCGTLWNTSSNSTLPTPDKNEDWNIRGFYKEGFYTTQKDPQGLYGLLIHNQRESDYFQWCYPTNQFQRGLNSKGETKWIPFDYKKLLSRFAPVFLFCYWDATTNSVIQIDRWALEQTGVVRTRHMNINEFRSYIFTQVKSIASYLRRFPSNEVVMNVFNDSRFKGDGLYPLRFTKLECETHLPTWTENPAGFYLISLSRTEVPQMNRESMYKVSLTHKLYTMHTTTDIPFYIKHFERLIGTSLTPDALQDSLDTLSYRKGVRKGRVTTIIRELKDEGIELERRKVWLDGKSQNMYFINRITAHVYEDMTEAFA